jgi:hypothetical protein
VGDEEGVKVKRASGDNGVVQYMEFGVDAGILNGSDLGMVGENVKDFGIVAGGLQGRGGAS